MAEERKIFHNSVVPIPVDTGLTAGGLMVRPAAAEHRDETMTLSFHMSMPDSSREELEELVASGKTMPRDQLRDYSAKPADAEKLATWLRGQGFKIEDRGEGADSSTVRATATVAKIEKALQVEMVRVAQRGYTYTAARNAPSLPAGIAASVEHINGLQPFLQAHKHAKCLVPKAPPSAAATPATRAPKKTATTKVRAPKPPYLVRDILKAYDADKLAVDGSNQVIAILIDALPHDADLSAFWAANGIPGNLHRIQKINVDGLPLPNPSGEETLDVEWTSGVAPKATIRIYATGSLEFEKLDHALDRIIADAASIPGLNQVSISLGLGETYFNGPDGEVKVEHEKFLKLAAAGVNVFVSTGDAGSNPDQTGQSATGPLQVEYESSDPFVVAVGGTTLELAANGSIKSEAAWSHGGGGKSIYFRRPAWQKQPNISGSRRLIPDLSVTADPEEGGLVVLQGKHLQYGGTSWSAPICAGFCALINDARHRAGKQPISFLNPLIYRRAQTCFRDITTGSNGAYHATQGFDLVTGLGAPRMDVLLHELVQLP